MRRPIPGLLLVLAACKSPTPTESPMPPEPAAAAEATADPGPLTCGEPEWEPYDSEAGLFSMEVPTDWEAKAVEKLVLRLRHPKGGIEIASSAGWVEDAPRTAVQAARAVAEKHAVLQAWQTDVLLEGGQAVTGTFDTGDSILMIRVEVRPSSYLMTTIESWAPFDDTCSEVMARLVASLRLNDVAPPAKAGD